MKEKWKQRLGSSLMVVLTLAMGIACGAAGGRILQGTIDSLWGILAVVLFFYAAVVLQILLHEAGHWMFGALTGYRCYSFRVFSLCFVMLDGKVSVKRFSLAGTGGQCLMAPPPLKDGKMPYKLYNLGGVLMNLITAGVSHGLYRLCAGRPWAALFFLLMAGVGVGFALMNGIPLHTAAIDNDGYNALSLGRSPEALQALWKQLTISEQTYRGVRLRDMSAAWFDMPEMAGERNALVDTIAVFRENRLMDAGYLPEAAALTDKLLEGSYALVGVYRQLLVCDRIFCGLMAGEDAAKLEALYTPQLVKFMGQMKNFPAVLRTAYAWELLHNREQEKAAQLQQRFERVAKSYPAPADAASERELMALAREKAAQENCPEKDFV